MKYFLAYLGPSVKTTNVRMNKVECLVLFKPCVVPDGSIPIVECSLKSESWGEEGIRRDRGMGFISYPTPSLLFRPSHIFFAPSLQSERFEQAIMGVKPTGGGSRFSLRRGCTTKEWRN